MKLLKCPYCNETLLRNSQGLSIGVKRKHLNKYVKEMRTNPSVKTPFLKNEKQGYFEVKSRRCSECPNKGC